VVQHHIAHQSPFHLDLRQEFEASIPRLLGEIRARWKPLAQYRSAYLAHRDVSKVLIPQITYAEIRECFEWAQRVLRDYFVAYEDSTHYFDIAGAKNDPPRFLAWCRLDDYQRHFDEDMKRRHEQALKDMGLGAKG
jgi:hypothetical protein